MAVRTALVRIGNSRGIRIPKSLLDQGGFGTEVELELHEDHLRVIPVKEPRAGWDEAFARMAERGDDALIDGEAWGHSEWDETEWEW
jgi:antitoxin MazE